MYPHLPQPFCMQSLIWTGSHSLPIGPLKFGSLHGLVEWIWGHAEKGSLSYMLIKFIVLLLNLTSAKFWLAHCIYKDQMRHVTDKYI